MEVNKWSKEEIEMLKKYYPTKNTRELSKILNRSITSIHHKASRLKIRKNPFWSKEEIEILKKYYPNSETSTLKKVLPNKTLKNIYSEAHKLGIKRNFKHYYHNKPNLKPSKCLSYVLGVMYGDGFKYPTSNNIHFGYRIGLNASDRKFVEYFKKCLENIGLNTSPIYVKEPNNDRKTVYTVQSYSVVFYKWFMSLTVDDLRRIINTDELKKYFVKGFYDSEGSCVHSHLHGKLYFRVSISNTNKEIISLVKDFIEELGIPVKFYSYSYPYKKSIEYKINIHTQSHVFKFYSLINPTIKRPEWVLPKWSLGDLGSSTDAMTQMLEGEQHLI